MLYFPVWIEKTSEGMAVRLTSDRKVEVILGFGGRQMVFYSIRENVDLEKWNHIFVIYRFREGWCDLVVNGVLSNRLQFGRFQKIKWPRHPIFIGKDADKDCLTPQMGVFWGWMKNIQFLSEAVSVEQAIKDSKRENSLEKVLYTPNRTRFLDDANRPQYHLIEPEKWMNEPHAPFFYNGYIISFIRLTACTYLGFHSVGTSGKQRYGSLEGSAVGIAVRKWFYDELGCWSGSGLVDKDGVPRIYYTAGK